MINSYSVIDVAKYVITNVYELPIKRRSDNCAYVSYSPGTV